MLFLGAMAVSRILTAVPRRGSAAPVHVVTASFRTATTILCGVTINTHHMPPCVAVVVLNIPKPSQAL